MGRAAFMHGIPAHAHMPRRQATDNILMLQPWATGIGMSSLMTGVMSNGPAESRNVSTSSSTAGSVMHTSTSHTTTLPPAITARRTRLGGGCDGGEG